MLYASHGFCLLSRVLKRACSIHSICCSAPRVFVWWLSDCVSAHVDQHRGSFVGVALENGKWQCRVSILTFPLQERKFHLWIILVPGSIACIIVRETEIKGRHYRGGRAGVTLIIFPKVGCSSLETPLEKQQLLSSNVAIRFTLKADSVRTDRHHCLFISFFTPNRCYSGNGNWFTFHYAPERRTVLFCFFQKIMATPHEMLRRNHSIAAKLAAQNAHSISHLAQFICAKRNTRRGKRRSARSRIYRHTISSAGLRQQCPVPARQPSVQTVSSLLRTSCSSHFPVCSDCIMYCMESPRQFEYIRLCPWSRITGLWKLACDAVPAHASLIMVLGHASRGNCIKVADLVFSPCWSFFFFSLLHV